MLRSDTIAAISSAVGPAARMIVRMSGPQSLPLAGQLGALVDFGGGSAFRCDLRFCELSAAVWVYLFRGPRSYTGEDLVEFHLPGSPVLVKMLLQELLRLGARSAEPGEFTARAYFNGRIDLTCAEGVAATIAAGSDQELDAARRLMAGELARRLAPAIDGVAGTLALVEVGIDFSEEDVSFLGVEQIAARVREADGLLECLLADSARFERLAHEPRVVLVGRPNSGKSTLLNALAGQARAIVSPIAGTTRDVLSAKVSLRRGIVQLVDVAGIDDDDLTEASASGEIGRAMANQALRAVEEADAAVLVRDILDTRPPLRLGREPRLVVRTKVDLVDRMVASSELAISAITGAGMQLLKEQLDLICFGEPSSGTLLALNIRHVQAIGDARAALARIGEPLRAGRPELIALELRESLDLLGGVVGHITPDDVLGRIFSGFCIGK